MSKVYGMRQHRRVNAHSVELEVKFISFPLQREVILPGALISLRLMAQFNLKSFAK